MWCLHIYILYKQKNSPFSRVGRYRSLLFTKFDHNCAVDINIYNTSCHPRLRPRNILNALHTTKTLRILYIGIVIVRQVQTRQERLKSFNFTFVCHYYVKCIKFVSVYQYFTALLFCNSRCFAIKLKRLSYVVHIELLTYRILVCANQRIVKC